MRRNIPKTMNGSSSRTTAKLVCLPFHPSTQLTLNHPNRLKFHTMYLPGTIGISEFAANALGDVVYIELPALDTEIHAGDTIGAVESVKSASDILTPLSGKVVAKNDFLEEKPGFINKEPEGKGWIARIEVVPGEEVEGLMGREEYRKFTEE